ncbi:MFS transporter [Sphingobium phenoxybenzoativorans]|uniref:MFS transporter n=1 Tax=Sphingobium phenoxybenzoativorans TaxID=1592790 RepID=UPI00149552E2|nr:MFS transporter [Sphingobium phenoxybenzoativorans]
MPRGTDFPANPNPSQEITGQSLTVIGVSLVGTFLAGLLVANAAMPVFLAPIAAGYGWSHAEIGAAVTFLFVGSGLGAPLIGPVVDKYGPRRVLLPLTLVSGLTLSSFSVIGASLPLFYAAHFILGMATPGAVAYSKLISTWFFRRRGIALTALGAGAFTASVAIPPLAHLLMSRFEWQNAYLVFGLAELLIALPLLFIFFRERPVSRSSSGIESNEVHPDGAPAIRILQAIRGKTYWLVVGAQLTGMFAYFGFGTHAIGIMTERGLDPTTATLGMSVYAAGGLLAQIATGILLDRFDTPRVIAPFAILSVISLAALFVSRGELPVIAALLFFGIGCGGQVSMTSYFTSRYFGVRNFSTIYGSLLPVLQLLSAPAAIFVGAIFDRTGSYTPALAMLEVSLLASALLFLLLEPYPYPVRDTPAEPDQRS